VSEHDGSIENRLPADPWSATSYVFTCSCGVTSPGYSTPEEARKALDRHRMTYLRDVDQCRCGFTAGRRTPGPNCPTHGVDAMDVALGDARVIHRWVNGGTVALDRLADAAERIAAWARRQA
jgi:hypothetical protein